MRKQANHGFGVDGAQPVFPQGQVGKQGHGALPRKAGELSLKPDQALPGHPRPVDFAALGGVQHEKLPAGDAEPVVERGPVNRPVIFKRTLQITVVIPRERVHRERQPPKGALYRRQLAGGAVLGEIPGEDAESWTRPQLTQVSHDSGSPLSAARVAVVKIAQHDK